MGTAKLKVDIQTQITPNIHLDLEKITQDAASGKKSPLLGIIKPKIVISGLGMKHVVAPAGEPTLNYFPAFILIIILSYLLTFYVGTKVGSS